MARVFGGASDIGAEGKISFVHGCTLRRERMGDREVKRMLLTFAITVVACLAGEPLMRFDFSKAANGVVPNSGTGKEFSAIIKGNVRLKTPFSPWMDSPAK